MTVRDEMESLWRLFPRAIEFAVSPDMAERYEEECARQERFMSTDMTLSAQYPVELFKAITAQRLPFLFRGKPLVLVLPT